MTRQIEDLGSKTPNHRTQKSYPKRMEMLHALCKDKDNLAFAIQCLLLQHPCLLCSGHKSVPGLGNKGVVGRRKVPDNDYPFYRISQLPGKLEVKVVPTAASRGNY